MGASPLDTSRMRECPGCGALVKRMAPRCRWCGRALGAGDGPRGTVRPRSPSAGEAGSGLAAPPDRFSCPACPYRGEPEPVPRVPTRAVRLGWVAAAFSVAGAAAAAAMPPPPGAVLAMRLRPLGYAAAGFLFLLAILYTVLHRIRVPGCPKCGARAVAAG